MEASAKKSIENIKEHNREDSEYRDFLVKEELVPGRLKRNRQGDIIEKDKKYILAQSDFDRVREIALKEGVKREGLTEEEFIKQVRSLAAFEYTLNRMIKEPTQKPTSEEIFKEIGLELSELISKLMYGNSGKADSQICVQMAKVSLDELVRDGAESEHFLDRVFDKISQRLIIAPKIAVDVTLVADKTGSVEVISDKKVASIE